MLSDLVGFFYMYLTVGLVGLSLVCLTIFLFHIISPVRLSFPKEYRSSVPILQIISHHRVLLYLSIMFLSGFSYTLSLPIIRPYLRARYGVGNTAIGFIMVLAETVSVLSLGLMLDRGYCNLLKTFSCLGILIQAVALFFYPPSSLLFSPSSDLLFIS